MAKPKFWTFDHPVLDSLSPYDSELIPALVESVKQGNIEAREKLLYQLLAYIKTRLGRILYKESRLRNEVDGLVSFLIEWLVKLIYDIANGKRADNIVNYVSLSLRLFCLRYLDTLLSFGPKERRYYAGVSQHNINVDSIYAPADPDNLLECLQSVVSTPEEAEFVRLRIEGYKNGEIATMLDLTATDISRIRKGLYRRFKNEF